MIDTHLQRSSGRDWGQELKSSSPLKKSVKVLGEALEESFFGESAEAASGLFLHSTSHRLEFGEVGQLTPGPVVWEMQREPRQPTEMSFLYFP